MTPHAPVTDDRLIDRLLDDLSREERREVDAALAHEPALAARSGSFATIVDAARTRPAPDAPPGVLARLLEAQRDATGSSFDGDAPRSWDADAPRTRDDDAPRSSDGDAPRSRGRLAGALPLVGVLALAVMVLMPPSGPAPGGPGFLVDSSAVRLGSGLLADTMTVALAGDSAGRAQPTWTDTAAWGSER